MSHMRGYDYSDVPLKKIQKDKFILSSEIEAQVTRNELKNQIEKVLSNNGRVYFISRKKEVCGVVIIKYEKHLASDFELETEKKDERQDEKSMTANAYVLESLYLNEDLKSKDMIIMKDLLEELKEAAAFHDLGVKVIIWKETIIADKTIGKTSESAIAIGMCLGMSVGMMFGVVFDNIGIGMCLGMSIGMLLGATYYGSSKKEA